MNAQSWQWKAAPRLHSHWRYCRLVLGAVNFLMTDLSRLRIALLHYWFVDGRSGERIVEVLAETDDGVLHYRGQAAWTGQSRLTSRSDIDHDGR